MKYFTPELYLRFNSPDERVVEKAHDDWEEAIEAYRKHLGKVAPRMTPSAREIAQNLCLHDAGYMGMVLPQLLTSDNSLALVATQLESKSVLLIYVLSEEPLIQEVNGKQKWPYSKENVRWLYDEFDVDEAGVQQHEVLLSNGRVLTFRFFEMQQIEHSVSTPSAVA